MVTWRAGRWMAAIAAVVCLFAAGARAQGIPGDGVTCFGPKAEAELRQLTAEKAALRKSYERWNSVEAEDRQRYAVCVAAAKTYHGDQKDCDSAFKAVQQDQAKVRELDAQLDKVQARWDVLDHLPRCKVPPVVDNPPPPPPPVVDNPPQPPVFGGPPPPPGTPHGRESSCPDPSCIAIANALNDAIDAYNAINPNTPPSYRANLQATLWAEIQSDEHDLEECEAACILGPSTPRKEAPPKTGEFKPLPPDHGMSPAAPGTGYYVGGALGERWTGTTWTAVGQTTLGGADMPASPRADLSSDPIRGKVIAGHDWAIAPDWIAGVVADAGFGSNSASRAGIPGSFGPGGLVTQAAGLNDRLTVKQDWDVGVRGRIGTFAWPNVLLYGTAGVDFLNSSYSINCTLAGACGPVGVPVSASGSGTHAGWTAGAGIQFGLDELGLGPGWNGQIEYLHTDFGSFNVGLGNPATFATQASVKETTDTLMFGVVYRFGPLAGLSPAVSPPPAAAPLPPQPLTPRPARGEAPRVMQVASLAPVQAEPVVSQKNPADTRMNSGHDEGGLQRFTIRFDDKMAALTPGGIKALDDAVAAIATGERITLAIEDCAAGADFSDGSACARRALSLKHLLAQRGVTSPRRFLIAGR